MRTQFKLTGHEEYFFFLTLLFWLLGYRLLSNVIGSQEALNNNRRARLFLTPMKEHLQTSSHAPIPPEQTSTHGY
ncbi:hypothetical protein QQF64_001377 [Cirrhinus molitorella]|uniref:Uncharacterized protein n=1 Tax=Cirrhinus molitorella TaxID=172907 RepID=A0ABR3P084_9TELE